MNTIRTWYLQRKTIRELEALPDNILEDIGLERHAIRAHVKNNCAQKTKTSIGFRPIMVKPIEAI